jgi:aspartate racemase
METLGLLGGTGCSSTLIYYKKLNELVQERLLGRHSAKILLKNIDYHEIQSNYGKDEDHLATLLEEELQGSIALKPDYIVICNITLHKFRSIPSYQSSILSSCRRAPRLMMF